MRACPFFRPHLRWKKRTRQVLFSPPCAAPAQQSPSAAWAELLRPRRAAQIEGLLGRVGRRRVLADVRLFADADPHALHRRVDESAGQRSS